MQELNTKPVGASIVGKIKLSLCLTKHHAMESYWESGGIAPRILISALDEGEWLASRPAGFTPTGRAPGTHWIGGWVGPRAGMDALVKKFPAHAGTRTSDHPARSLVLYHWANPAPGYYSRAQLKCGLQIYAQWQECQLLRCGSQTKQLEMQKLQ
jgi:hypothetical protein